MATLDPKDEERLKKEYGDIFGGLLTSSVTPVAYSEFTKIAHEPRYGSTLTPEELAEITEGIDPDDKWDRWATEGIPSPDTPIRDYDPRTGTTIISPPTADVPPIDKIGFMEDLIAAEVADESARPGRAYIESLDKDPSAMMRAIDDMVKDPTAIGILPPEEGTFPYGTRDLGRPALPTIEASFETPIAPVADSAITHALSPSLEEYDRGVASGEIAIPSSAYASYEVDRALEKAGVTKEEFATALKDTGHKMTPDEYAYTHLYKGLEFTPGADLSIVGTPIAEGVKDVLGLIRAGKYAITGRDDDSALIDKVKSYLEFPDSGISALGPKDAYPEIIDPSFAPDASIHYSDPLKHYDTETVPGHLPLSLTTPFTTAVEGIEHAAEFAPPEWSYPAMPTPSDYSRPDMELDAATRAMIDADMAAGIFPEVAGKGPIPGTIYDARDFIRDFGSLTASTHGEDPWRGLSTADFATDAKFRPSGLAKFGLGVGSLGAGLMTYSEPLGVGSDIPGRIPAAHHGPVFPEMIETPIDATGAPIEVDDFSSMPEPAPAPVSVPAALVAEVLAPSIDLGKLSGRELDDYLSTLSSTLRGGDGRGGDWSPEAEYGEYGEFGGWGDASGGGDGGYGGSTWT